MMIAMHFPISGTDISPVYLVVIGFLIGIMGGFFGVGGSFIAGPALRAAGMHWNFAVGTDLPAGAFTTRTEPSQGRFGWADALIQFEIVAGLAFAVGFVAAAVRLRRYSGPL